MGVVLSVAGEEAELSSSFMLDVQAGIQCSEWPHSRASDERGRLEIRTELEDSREQ